MTAYELILQLAEGSTTPDTLQHIAKIARKTIEGLDELKTRHDIADIVAGELKVSRGTAYDMMREALKDASPVQEPVAWCTKSDLENMAKGFSQDVPARSMRVPQLYPEGNTVLLYTTPPAAQRQWVGLTPDQRQEIWDSCDSREQAIERTEAMLADKNAAPPAAQPAPVQEPYGYVSTHTNGLMHFNKTFQGVYSDTATGIVAVYTTPPAAQRQWTGLTDEEIYDSYNEPRSDSEMVAFAREVEAKLKEKNAPAQPGVAKAA